MFGLALIGAGPDPSGMSCTDIIKGYEKNVLLASPEGGRSAKHRKNSAARVEELKPFYDDCVAGSTDAGQAREDQATIDAIYGQPSPDGPYPLTAPIRRPVVSSGIGTGPMIALGVIAALGVVYFLKKGK
jgi:hypothetical protein